MFLTLSLSAGNHCQVALNSFQHLVKIFSAFGRHTFHPRPQDGVFMCALNTTPTNSVYGAMQDG